MQSSQDPQVSLLQRMVEIYSPSGQEAEIAGVLIDEMAGRGLRTGLDEAGNVVGWYGEAGPRFLLCGHMDTVPGKLPVRHVGNRLFGRGAVDAKPALAAMVSAAGVLASEEFPARIQVVGAVDEEGLGRGMKHVIAGGVQADYAVFGEPSGSDSITIAYRGSLHVRVVCSTGGGHSSSPWLSRNAVEEAFNVWGELQRIHFPEERLESRFYSTSSSIKQIHGGGSGSTIPSLCELHGDFRIPPKVSSERLFVEILRTVDSYSSRNSGVKVVVGAEDSTEPYEADAGSLLVRGLSWATREILGRPAVLLRKTGTGDMNLLGATTRMPVVTYGPGDSSLDHTSDECVDLDEYKNSIKILCQGLRRTLQLHNRLRPS
jgi:LysW-gamma-L-lysine carboxypeptidase